jgi:hypothetical protein
LSVLSTRRPVTGTEVESRPQSQSSPYLGQAVEVLQNSREGADSLASTKELMQFTEITSMSGHEEATTPSRDISGMVEEITNRTVRLEQEYKDLKCRKRRQLRRSTRLALRHNLPREVDPANDNITRSSDRRPQLRGRMWYIV